MHVKTRTATVHTHYIEIDGQEFGTTLPADEYIDPRIEVEGNRTEIFYAVRDEYPFNPRENYEPAGTMVRTRDGYNGIDIDEPGSEFNALYELAGTMLYDTANGRQNEVYYVVACGCAWSKHTVEEAEAGECAYPYEGLIFGTDEDHFEDGSTYGVEFILGGMGDFESDEGIAALLDAGLNADRYTSVYDLMKAYVEVGMPHVTAFIEWTFNGYSQGDWAEGYAFMTADDFTDPEAALRAEVAEYAAWANGDVYLCAREVYIDGESIDYDVVGGYYGEDAIEDAIKRGDF